MGNHFNYRLQSLSVGPFMAPPHGHHTWGARLSPRLELHLANGLFAELRVEGGIAHEDRSPLGVNMFNSNPSSTMDERNPLVYRHVPEGSEDHLRANFGLRNLVFGYQFNQDFSIKVGRYRFDQTEYERLFNTNAWSQPINYARVNMRLDWIGAELRYDHRSSTGTLRQGLASSNITENADGTYLSMSQTLLSFALNEGVNPPLLSLTGYFAWKTNVIENNHTLDPGHTLGGGVALMFDYRNFTAGVSETHSSHQYMSTSRVRSFQDRTAFSALLDYHPHSWRIRGLISYLTRIENRGENPYDSPVWAGEVHGELAAGYNFFNGLTPALVYRFVSNNRENYAAHILAIGLQTSWQGTVPF